MKATFIILLFISSCVMKIHAQQDSIQPKDGWKNTRNGNESFKKKDFPTAERHYREGVKTDTSYATANYNLGNALYRQKKYAEAERAYAESTSGINPDSLAKSWHNLGNAMLQQEKYQESINAYKQALKLNPKDEQTRHNLAFAQAKQKARQPPPNKNQKNQKDKKNQKNQQQKNEDGSQDKQKSKPSPGNKTQPSMSKDEAQRMLDALKDEERKTRNKMNSLKKSGAVSESNEKDW